MLAATRICRAPRLASHSRECPSMPLTFSPVTSEDEWLEICTLRSVGTGGGAPIPAGCSDDQQAPLAGETDLRFGAAVEPSISDFSPSRPP